MSRPCRRRCLFCQHIFPFIHQNKATELRVHFARRHEGPAVLLGFCRRGATAPSRLRRYANSIAASTPESPSARKLTIFNAPPLTESNCRRASAAPPLGPPSILISALFLQAAGGGRLPASAFSCVPPLHRGFDNKRPDGAPPRGKSPPSHSRCHHISGMPV